MELLARRGILNILRLPGFGLLLALPSCVSPEAVNVARSIAPASAGVVVESVKARSTGAAAGLQPGDVILSWSCAASPPAFPRPASGPIRSPYDLLPLEIEESPRRAVELRGKRGNEEKVWTLRAGSWGIETRPALPPDGDGRLAAWYLERQARTLAEAQRWPEAEAAYQQALAILERELEPLAASELLLGWGKTLLRSGRRDEAHERYQTAVEITGKARPGLAAARTLSVLGVAFGRAGRYEAAGDLLRQALVIREELAPETTEVADSLHDLGILARRQGDLAAAEDYLVRGEDIQRRLAPDTDRYGLLLVNLGNVAEERGDLERAERLNRQALAIFESNAPESDLVAGSLQNLGNIATQRGDLAEADDLLRRVLALQERRAPGEQEMLRTLIGLGHLAALRRDLEAAELYYRRAATLSAKLSPDGRETALSLGSLGEVALLQGDFAAARRSLWRAQEIEERIAPKSLDVARGLEDLGRLEVESGGDLATAETLLRRALVIFETAAPESLGTSVVLRDLGEVAARRGRWEEALALHRRALGLQTQLGPGSSEEAEALYFLGRAERRAGQSKEGVRDLCRAIDVLDRQRARLGGTPEAKTSFEASLGDYYHACLEGLLDLGRSVEAFHVLERGRARSFLARLAERDLRLSDLPPELAAERRRVNAQYDQVQSQLAALSAGRDHAEIERLTGELRDLRARQEEILDRIRRESPRSAALQDPEPLTLAGARAALDPGTVLLEYAVGKERSWLFVVQAADASGPGLSVFPVHLGAKGLRGEVEDFRLLLRNPGSDEAEIHAQARRLYALLVRPAEAQVAGAQRILVAADGPLHTLAFAALRRGDRYLVEWKPIHAVLSATVYAQLARTRPANRNPGEERLAAFGNPVYPQAAPDGAADPEVREALRRGLTLAPLPSSAEEVRSIADLYPEAEVYLGRDATEEKAKALGPTSRLVHFACHGLLDERFPLNSALVLTLPEQPAEGRDNGLLQAWEIFESMRLDAELVTLSACDTALGREAAGEGLVGLTRAFQYAGARSVLASLWEVSDLSTARLMQRFYGHLRAGKPKDEALRAAQIEQIADRTASSHPFHWAAFLLTGDWR